MNIGIYVPTLANHEQLDSIHRAVNNSLDSGLLDDASLFYDSVAPNPFPFKCGLFNSTDLWNFNGQLITTSLSTTLSALKIINNLELYYYYGFEDKISPLSLIYVAKTIGGVNFIANSDEMDKDLYRKTGHKSIFTTDRFDDLFNKIGELWTQKR